MNKKMCNQHLFHYCKEKDALHNDSLTKDTYYIFRTLIWAYRRQRIAPL